jgi:hypothetical protein
MLLGLALAAAPAHAQATPARELEAVRALYNAGNYNEALTRARQAMAVVNFSEVERIELLKMAGLSAFALNDAKATEQLFYQLLLLNPDYVLDPFAAPPPAIRLFEDVRRKNADALNVARQQISLREERQKRENEDREREKARAEEQRRRLDALSRTQRTVVEKPFVVNFLPFGAGQFQQGRTGLGVLFATSEGALGATSLIAFLAIESLFETRSLVFENRLGTPDTYTVKVRRIPAERATERDVWTAVKYASAGAFYVMWGVGIVDAIVHHQSEVVTETPILAPTAPTAAPPRTSTRMTPFLFPTQGGLGGGLTLDF